MRVKITVLYDEGEESLTRETKKFDLMTVEDDEDSFQETKDYLEENLVEAYADDGYELEPDEDEEAIGTDYAGAWTIPEPFESRGEAKEFLEQIIKDTEALLADLE